MKGSTLIGMADDVVVTMKSTTVRFSMPTSQANAAPFSALSFVNVTQVLQLNEKFEVIVHVQVQTATVSPEILVYTMKCRDASVQRELHDLIIHAWEHSFSSSDVVPTTSTHQTPSRPQSPSSIISPIAPSHLKESIPLPSSDSIRFPLKAQQDYLNPPPVDTFFQAASAQAKAFEVLRKSQDFRLGTQINSDKLLSIPPKPTANSFTQTIVEQHLPSSDHYFDSPQRGSLVSPKAPSPSMSWNSVDLSAGIVPSVVDSSSPYRRQRIAVPSTVPIQTTPGSQMPVSAPPLEDLATFTDSVRKPSIAIEPSHSSRRQTLTEMSPAVPPIVPAEPQPSSILKQTPPSSPASDWAKRQLAERNLYPSGPQNTLQHRVHWRRQLDNDSGQKLTPKDTSNPALVASPQSSQPSSPRSLPSQHICKWCGKTSSKEHEIKLCSQRPVKCGACQKQVLAKDFVSHIDQCKP
eukprot:PhF_6_TR43516/c0_g1_i1/m.66801